MSDPNDPRYKRSEKLAADLFLDEDGGGTVPELEPSRLSATDPPTIPIDISGFQEAPMPQISFPVKETSASRAPPLAFPPKESSASRMSSSPPPASLAYPEKESS